MIVVIGDSSVGKSSLIRKFAQPSEILSDSKTYTATVGVDFMFKNIVIND